jgi:aminoglycoside phosphotransferase (APT) family kinase protein
MDQGAPEEARWFRSEPRRTLPASDLQRIVHTAFPRARVIEIHPLGDGLRNSNFLLRLESVSGQIVLRIYEHDPSLCQKEIDLMRLVAGSVPVPEIIQAMPSGFDNFPPFTLARFVNGVTFRDLRRGGDLEAIAQAAYSAGETLAAIGRITFANPGWLMPGPTVGPPLMEGRDPYPRFVDCCLESANLQQRLPLDLRKRTSKLAWSFASQFAALENETHLVHGDFNKRNLLAHQIAGRWSVAAVLDWEFAVSGSPLADFGNFLRYERATRLLAEPHFSSGFVNAGGALPENWRRLARLVDLIALCESLTRDELPLDIAAELVELVRATVENRDPHFANAVPQRMK